MRRRQQPTESRRRTGEVSNAQAEVDLLDGTRIESSSGMTRG